MAILTDTSAGSRSVRWDKQSPARRSLLPMQLRCSPIWSARPASVSCTIMAPTKSGIGGSWRRCALCCAPQPHPASATKGHLPQTEAARYATPLAERRLRAEFDVKLRGMHWQIPPARPHGRARRQTKVGWLDVRLPSAPAGESRSRGWCPAGPAGKVRGGERGRWRGEVPGSQTGCSAPEDETQETWRRRNDRKRPRPLIGNESRKCGR